LGQGEVVAGGDRALLEDGYRRGLEGQSIADKLGINRSTVHRRLGRVLKKLRRELR
jgi:DNA-directed RNA polymerase specialized sigma24 family protein